MPPRYAYWTIIAGGLPTAFRAADREELLPTFQRIKHKHPDAQMKYFARGKLWESAEAARSADKPRIVRDRDWRPGGTHRDPRQKFIDAKKQRNTAMRKERWERKNAPAQGRKPWVRGQGTEERPTPRPRGPNREPIQKEGWTRKNATAPRRKPWIRGQGTEEAPTPPRPRGPNREPKPSEDPEPTPPREEEPKVPPPGPPVRGHGGRRYQPGGRFPKRPRR